MYVWLHDTTLRSLREWLETDAFTMSVHYQFFGN